MNLSEYQIAAERTMVPTQPRHEAMLNAALGLCGEAAEAAKAYEYDTAHLPEECGDLLWYVAQMCWAHGESIANIPPNDQGWNEERALEMLWHHSGFVADQVKKYVFHQRPISVVVFFDSLAQVITAVETLLGFHGVRLETVCAANNQKLLKRFPAGYTHADANARKDEADHV